MSKNSKITITVVAVVLALCIAAVAITVTLKKRGEDASQSTSFPPASDSSETLPSNVDLSKDILGKWTDSSEMSGYEFFADGTVSVTYVNLTIPVVNIPINGKVKGTYNLNGSSLEINYSIYRGNIHMFFTASIEGNVLTLVDLDDHDTYTYMRPSEITTTATESTGEVVTPPHSSDNPLVGSWKSSDNRCEYIFFENGSFSVRFYGKNSIKEYTGVYIQDDNGSLIIQYSAGDDRITNTYNVEINGLSMSLRSENGDVTLFVKVAGESESLIGKWQDSSGMSGFEFKENGVVKVTYINFKIPVLNIPINGTFDGSYSVSGDSITIGYSFSSNSISDTYYYSVSGSTLKLVNVSDGEETTYIKVE